MYTPTVHELKAALAAAHGMSLEHTETSVLKLMKEANPSWSVSAKVSPREGPPIVYLSSNFT